MTQQIFQHIQQGANDPVTLTEWNADIDQAAPGHVGGTGRAFDFVVAGSDMDDYFKNEADFVASGSDDLDTINAAFNALPAAGGSVALFGTFTHDPAETTDKIVLSSNQTLFLANGAEIVFNGDNTSDHHVIDIDGSTTAVVGAQVLGSGTITCKNAGDHGLRLQGDVTDCLISDTIRIIHDGSTAASDDEGIVLTGADRCTRNTIRKIYVEGFARNIELGSNAYGNTIDLITSKGGTDGIQLTGRTATPTGVKFNDTTEGYIDLAAAFDNNVGTSVSVEDAANNGLATADELLIACDGRTKALYVDMAAAVNAQTAVLSVSLSDGAGGWISVNVVRDETSSGGAPFAVDGEIEWVLDDDWESQTEDTLSAFWVRITTSANLDSFDVNEIYQRKFPHGNVLTRMNIIETSQHAVNLTSARYNTIATSNMTNAGQSGVNIDEASSLRGPSHANTIDNNLIQGSADNGVIYAGGKNTSVTNNRFIANGKAGVVAGDAETDDAEILDNKVLHNGLEGIATRGERVRLDGNVIANNGRDTTGTDKRRSGVRVINGSAIIGPNTIVDDDLGTQQYAVYIDGGSASIVDLDRIVTSGNAQSPEYTADGGTAAVVRGKNNLGAAVAPGVNDDITLGYWPGSNWYDTTNVDAYVCLDNTDGAAVWKKTTP